MPKVTVVQVVYNNRKFIEPVFSAIFNQAIKDFNVVAVIAGNDDGSKELLQQKFPQVEIIDPGYNIGFAAGHNLVFEKYDSEFFQLVNPDLIMEPDYIGGLLKAFVDPAVGVAIGKLLRYDFSHHKKTNIIDSTGVVISKSGHAFDRGQHEVDHGQYDHDTELQAVTGAGPLVRRTALEAVALWKPGGGREYFDEDFHSYFEDVDLFWRMSNAGWKNVYVPTAVAYHGRGTASHPGGFKRFRSFVKYHKAIPQRIKDTNFKNHIFSYIKNSRWLYPEFFIREFFMFGYTLVFEPATLKVLPEMWKLLPKMWRKRKIIQSLGV